MNTKTYTYQLLLLLPAILLFSCTQEDMPAGAGETENPRILFHVSLPAIVSRSNDPTVAPHIIDNGFHVSAFCPEDEVNGNELYFSEQYAGRLAEDSPLFGIFDQSSESSELCVWPTSRHYKRGQLKFFAFYPSREVLRQSSGGTDDNFVLVNKSTKDGSTFTYDYRMEKFKVHSDITRHIDFVTAAADGSKLDNGDSGVNLAFEHQLSRIVLTAWGNTTNDIEIAGVRIGRAFTECDFNFAKKPTNYAKGDATLDGDWASTTTKWQGTNSPVKGSMEYIFREGDVVVKIGRESHKEAADAASIMGNGKCAMVIPADNTGWKYKTDAENKNKGLYFSVLLRVKQHDDNNTLVYPYVAGGHFSDKPGDLTDNMTLIYMSINKETGKVMKRLYRDTDGKYFTDPGFTDSYTAPETEEIRHYGWAAIPLADYRWKPGYQYTYTLDYSAGVGVHDPDDPYPGTPIISKVLVNVTEDKKSWPTVIDYDSFYKNEEGKAGSADVTDIIKIE